ncbi:MAG: CxxxxCH/CxxCH domain-containing protein [Nitrospirae bacterium]|nr:CxxxxCH/CxxCH domain-containing protein [Nitrospirota bacterium]
MGTCSNVYCHSNTKVSTSGEVPLPTVPPYLPPLVYNPPWESLVVKTTEYKAPTWGVDSLGCNGCHGNPPMTAYPTVSAGAGDSHGWIDNFGFISLHVWNMGFAPLQCNTCHNDTVRADAAWSRTEYSIVFGNVPIYNTAKHVNGKKDVAFTLTKGFYSGNVKLTGASFDPVTKNCSNVICHGPQTPVKWGTPYRSWNGYECDVCHQGW